MARGFDNVVGPSLLVVTRLEPDELVAHLTPHFTVRHLRPEQAADAETHGHGAALALWRADVGDAAAHLQLLQSARRALGGVPVVLVVTRLDEELRRAGDALGVEDWLVAPFSPSEAVARALAVWRAAKRRQDAIVDATRAAESRLLSARASLQREIRERRSSMSATRRSRDALSETFIASPLPMIVRDRYGRVKLWSMAAESLFGWTAEEVIGREDPTLAPRDREALAKLWSEVLEGRALCELPSQRRVKDDGVVDVAGWLSPWRDVDAQGEDAMLEILVDVTEGKRAARLAEAARENERRRIARELHDQLGQLTTATLLALERAVGAMPAAPHEAADAIAKARALVERLGEQVHAQALAMRPTALDDFGLQAAVVGLVEEWRRCGGLRIDIQVVDLDQMRFDSAVETAVFRVVQEALTNAVKHAKASVISVVLERRGGELVAIVDDDGRGFEVAGADHERLGLRNMRERAALVGGSVDIESSEGSGTSVFVRVPLTDGEGGPDDG